MQLRAWILFLAACLGAGCGGGGAGKIMADTTVPTKEDPKALLLPYVPPDISELTGIPEEDEVKGASAPAPTAPAPAKVPAPAAKP